MPRSGCCAGGQESGQAGNRGPGAGVRRTIGVRTGTGHVFFLAAVRVAGAMFYFAGNGAVRHKADTSRRRADKIKANTFL